MQPSNPQNPAQSPQGYVPPGYPPFYTQQKSFVETMFSGTRPILIMLLSFLIIWIGLLLGVLANSVLANLANSVLTNSALANSVLANSYNSYISMMVVGYIFYSLGIILLLFTILGLVLTDNSMVQSVKVALVIFALIIFYAALIYPPLVSLITNLITKVLP